MAHKWAQWLHNLSRSKWPTSRLWLYKPCRLGGPRRLEAVDNIPRGYLTHWLHTPAVSRVPHPSERGTKSEVAHKWAQWLHNPYRL